MTPGGGAPVQLKVRSPSLAIDSTSKPMDAVPPGLTCKVAASELISRGTETAAPPFPLPDNATVLVPSLLVKINVAERLPLACGVNVTLTLQELPGANDAGQALALAAKSAGLVPPMVKLWMLSAVRPTFLSCVVKVVWVPIV